MSESTNTSTAREVLADFLEQRQIALSQAQLAQLLEYCGLIMRWNRLTSLVQVRTPEELVRGHVIDCLAALSEIKGPRVADVGTGAGLPGLVFAIAKPDWFFYLVEANERRARFLTQVKIELSLDNIEIVNRRVEQWHAVPALDCIVSRAFSSLDTFYKTCRHLEQPANNNERHSGKLLFAALKGRVTEQELASLEGSSLSVQVKSLEVPGRDHRHVVLIETRAAPT